METKDIKTPLELVVGEIIQCIRGKRNSSDLESRIFILKAVYGQLDSDQMTDYLVISNEKKQIVDWIVFINGAIRRLKEESVVFKSIDIII